TNRPKRQPPPPKLSRNSTRSSARADRGTPRAGRRQPSRPLLSIPGQVGKMTDITADRAVESQSHKKVSWFDAESIVAFIFFVLTAILVAAPVIYLIYGSLRTESPGAPNATWTFANWIRVYSSPTYLRAFFNTVSLSTTVAV